MAFDFDPTPPDPFDRIDYLMNKPFRGLGMGGAASPEYRRPLQPQEYSFLRDTLLGGGMSGLRGLGLALSASGDYARSTAMGALGAGSFGERKSGRDLTDWLGVTRKGDQGWLPWGVGLAADIATDPLTYIAPFGKTLAGKALSKLAPTEGGIQALSRVQKMRGFEGLESGLKKASAMAGASPQEAADFAAHLGHGGAAGGLKFSAPGMMATAAQEAKVASELGRPLKAAEPLISLLKIQAPFGLGPQLNIGTGALSQKIAGKMDWLGNKLAYGNMLSRGIGRVIDPARQGVGPKAAQESFALAGAGTDVMKAAEAEGIKLTGPMHLRLEELWRANPGKEGEYLRAANALATGAPISHYDPKIIADLGGIGKDIAGPYEGRLAALHEAGVATPEARSLWGLRYTHQQALHDIEGMPYGRSTPANMKAAHDIAREPWLQFPGGIDRVNEWTSAGLADPARFTRDQVARKIYADSLQDLTEITRLGTFPGRLTSAKDLWTQAKLAAERLPGLMGKQGPTGEYKGLLGPTGIGPLYRNDPVGLMEHYMTTSARKLGVAESLHRQVAEHAVPAGTLPAGTATSLADFNTMAKLRNWVPEVAGQPVVGATVKQLEKLAPKDAPMVGPLQRFLDYPTPRSIYLRRSAKVPSEAMLLGEQAKWELPTARVEEMLAAKQLGQIPEELRTPMMYANSMTNAFRALAYPIWLASHVRNAATAGLNLLRTDTPLGALKSVVEQYKEMRNPNFADPAVAASRLEQLAHGGIGSGHGLSTQTAGMNVAQRTATGNRITPQLAQAYGLGPQGVSPTGSAVGDAANLILNEGALGTLKALGRTVKEAMPGPYSGGSLREAISRNLGIKGVGGQLADTLPAVQTGWKVGENIENLFRGAQMKSLLRQGYSPAEAGRQMLKYQFDYGRHGFTPVERNVLRTLFPFYGFMRKNIPLQLETLGTRPGVIGAQLAPMMQRRTQPEQDYIPQYLQGNVAVPAGPEVEGKQQFFSTFGLPAEEAFGKIRPGSLQDTLMGFAANLNPLIKGPLEYLTDRQFFSGRQLSDLRPSSLVQSITEGITGEGDPRRDQMLTQLLMNLPPTRFFTTAQRLADPRKAWWQTALSLGTGVRVTDVDVDRQRAIETRDALLEAAGAKPHLAKYTSVYVPHQYQEMLRPDEIEFMRMVASYQKRAAEHAEQKKREQLLAR